MLNQIKRNDYNDTVTINQIITDIIDSRNNDNSKQLEINMNDTNDNNKSAKNGFDTLPSIMISEIGSYLELKCLTNFVYTPRYNAISCHSSPTTIYALKGYYWFDKYLENYGQHLRMYQIANITRFRMVKEVEFKIQNIYYNYWDNANLFKFNHLNELAIGNGQFRGYYNLDESIMNHLENITFKTLKLDGIGIQDIDGYKYLIQLLCKNKNIECLSINNVWIEEKDDNDSLYQNFKQLTNLKALVFMPSIELDVNKTIQQAMIGDNIMNLLNTQIESLHLSSSANEYVYNLSMENKIGFPNLKELCLWDMDDIEFESLIKKTQKLERVKWHIFENIEHDKIKKTIDLLLNNNLSLKYLCVSGNNYNLNNLWNPIVESLENTIIQRTVFKLRINLYHRLNNDEIDFIEQNLLKMVDILDNMTEKDFMFITLIEGRDLDGSEFEGIQTILNDMRDKYMVDIIPKNTKPTSTSCTRRKGTTRKKIIISNKQNKICGYHQSWMFSCNCCNSFILTDYTSN